MKSPEEQIKWEMQALGCEQKSLIENKQSCMSNLMEAMSWLSDAQEVIGMNKLEEARQFINRGKVFILLEIEKEMEGL